jgi:hypothetical protein
MTARKKKKKKKIRRGTLVCPWSMESLAASVGG